MNTLVRRYCAGLSAGERAQVQAIWDRLSEQQGQPSDKPSVITYAKIALGFVSEMKRLGRNPVELRGQAPVGTAPDSFLYSTTGFTY